MTPTQPADRQPPAAHCSIPLHRGDAVRRARGMEAAPLRVDARHQLPAAHEQQQHAGEGSPTGDPIRWRIAWRHQRVRSAARRLSRSTSRCSVVNGARTVAGRASITRSTSLGSRACRTAARSRRFARLRSTAPPIARPATTATCVGTLSSRPSACTTIVDDAARNRADRTARMRRDDNAAIKSTSSGGEGRAPLRAAATDDGAAGTGPHA